MMWAPDLLAGRVALVTGGTRGIGREVATRLADAGATVVAASRGADDFVTAAGNPVHGQILDVSDPTACQAAVAACQERHGSLDILVNNAGIAESTKFLRMTPEHWHRHLAVDVEAAVWLVQAALPSMVERGFGRVISVGSLASHLGFSYVTAYVAAKHALLGVTRSWAVEFARTALTFNCVSPYYVNTEMAETTIENIMAATGRSRDEAEALLMTPQGRIIEPDEVAEMCVYLCSDAARSVTGQSIAIDGGRGHS
jgi:3-hydroxybutyrate dehydrogenase